MSGEALAMRLKLNRLMREHRVAAEPCDLPLLPPTEHPQVLEGYAATCDLDLDRVRLSPFAFPLIALPPLYLKHDTSAPVGRIEDLAKIGQGGFARWPRCPQSRAAFSQKKGPMKRPVYTFGQLDQSIAAREPARHGRQGLRNTCGLGEAVTRRGNEAIKAHAATKSRQLWSQPDKPLGDVIVGGNRGRL